MRVTQTTWGLGDWVVEYHGGNLDGWIVFEENHRRVYTTRDEALRQMARLQEIFKFVTFRARELRETEKYG